MGTIPVDHCRRADETGQTWIFNTWTTTDALAFPEFGTLTITIISEDSDHSDPTHVLHVCWADWSQAWHRRFLRAFCLSAAFRQTCLIPRTTPGPLHATVSVPLPTGVAAIDTALAPAILALNQAGTVTATCCQGDHGVIGYITLQAGHFPPPLITAWQHAGFLVESDRVYAQAPWGLEAQAAQLWRESLDDWLRNTLDVNGQRYRVTQPRPSSLPALPALSTPTDLASVREAIQRLVHKGPHAKFRDYAALHSGRDAYSALRLTELLALLPDSARTHIKQSEWPARDQAAAARWILRGLPLSMALRKVEVDQEIRRHAGHAPR